MATEIHKSRCIKYEKERCVVRCEGCLQLFCSNHLIEHHQELNQQLDQIEFKRDVFRQTLTERTNDTNKYVLVNQINQWEEDSIKIIHQTAEDCRQLLIKYVDENIHRIEINLAKLTDEIKNMRQENDFNDINLNKCNQKLKQLQEELDKPLDISIQKGSKSLINEICVVPSSGNSVY